MKNENQRYNKKSHKDSFIQSGTFCVPLDFYMQLSEKKRKYMFLNTRLILDQMAVIEGNTWFIREGLSEARTSELARSVICLADAFKEHMSHQHQKACLVESDAPDAEKVQEVLMHEGYDDQDFKQYRFIKTYDTELHDISEEQLKVQESVQYTERGFIFDYIYESWKEAVQDKISDTCVSNVSVNRANESIQAVHARVDFQKKQQDRMKAYLGHLKGGDYVMLDGR